MKITKEGLEASTERLAVLLAPYYDILNLGKSTSPGGLEQLKVTLWDQKAGGVRIAEIAVLYRSVPGGEVGGGTSVIRTDVLNGCPGSGYLARLFLACENWLVGDLLCDEKSKTMQEAGEMLREEAVEQISAAFKAMRKAEKRSKSAQ